MEIKLNPHCKQWEEVFTEKIETFSELQKSPNLKDPPFDYQELNIKRSVCHWGQRKLFLSELDFFTKFLNGQKVVYIGASPGTHLLLLSELFPDLEFILYDPRDFDNRLYNNPKFKLFQKRFSEIDALIYSKGNYLLISDIRTSDTDFDSPEIKERKISADMYFQERIYELMKPEKALLKFRLPFPFPNNPILYGGKTVFNYLAGEIKLQAFSRKESSETRLIPNGKRENYDLKKYGNAMFSFNIYNRPALYKYQEKVEGLDHCFDCSTEVKIWKEYLEKTKTKETVNNLSQKLNNILVNGKYNPITYSQREFKY